MKFLSLFGRLVLWSMFILFCATIATFFLSVAMPTQVFESIKFFQKLFTNRLTTANLYCIM